MRLPYSADVFVDRFTSVVRTIGSITLVYGGPYLELWVGGAYLKVCRHKGSNPHIIIGYDNDWRR